MRKLLVILSLVFMLIAPTSVYGTSREYFIDKLNVEAVILDNGDVVVNEIMDYRFNGQFNGVYRNLALIGTEEYVINSVSIIDEDGNVIEAVEDYSEENNTYEIDEDFERTQIKLFCKSSNESKKIQLNYTIKAAALRYLDYSELYWNFYNVENIESVKEGNIKISLKDAEFDEEILYYDIYGDGEIETSHTKDYINISFKNLTTLIGIDMKFQAGYLSNVEESELYEKENIIDEYEYYYDEDYILDDFDNINQYYYEKEDNSDVIGFLIIGAIVIGGISTIFIYSSNQSKFEKEVSEYRKNNIITKAEIVMEPPSDLPPALVNLLINEKVVSKEMLNVTLFYLANKGYYTIEEKINDLKKVKHDYGSQISYLYGLCLMGKYDKLTDSLKSIINGHDNIISEVEIYNNDSIISMIVNGIKHKGINIFVDEQASLEDINVSEMEIQRIVSNILNNSVTAMNEKGLIIVRTYYSLNSVVIKIQNNGPKIEDEIIDKIFDVGFTTKENSNKEHGLGLAIVKEIVERNNGKVSVSSNDTITEFIIKIPAKISI